MKALAAMITTLTLSGAVALAQTNPGSPTTPPQPSQSSIATQDDTNHSTSGHSSTDSTTSMSDKHAAMKSCVTQQQQTNSGMSKADARKACKAQMKNNG